MAACTPATNAVDRILVLIDELEKVIAEIRHQAEQWKEDDSDRPDH
jgi:hypothetical protein